MQDFKDFTISCSQIASLMGTEKHNTPPTDNQVKKLLSIIGRDYNELSESMKHTAKEIMSKFIDYEPNKPSNRILSEIVLIYCYEFYGKGKVAKGNDSPLQLAKGSIAENESIRLLSKIDGVDYQKNEKSYKNKWFNGIPDIIVLNKSGNVSKVIEIKTSYDLPSFILNKYNEERKQNVMQIMGYMDLLGCQEGEIVHCLPDMPKQIVDLEKRRLEERYKTLQLDQLDIDSKLNQAISSMEYSEIPDELRVFRRKITKNALTMKYVKSRVTASKKWIKSIHDTFTKDSLPLPKESEENQEGSI